MTVRITVQTVKITRKPRQTPIDASVNSSVFLYFVFVIILVFEGRIFSGFNLKAVNAALRF